MELLKRLGDTWIICTFLACFVIVHFIVISSFTFYSFYRCFHYPFHYYLTLHSLRPFSFISLDCIVVGVFGPGPIWPPVVSYHHSNLLILLSGFIWVCTLRPIISCVWRDNHELAIDADQRKDIEWRKTLNERRLLLSSTLGAVQARTGENLI